VETALAITLLLTVSLGLLDFGRVFYIQAGLTNAAREGAREATRQAALQPPTCNLTAIRARVKAEQPGLWSGIPFWTGSSWIPMTPAQSDLLITANCLVADRRTVTIQNYPFRPITPFVRAMLGVGAGSLLLTTRATLPVTS
jgi:hypothetical protein